MGAVKTSRDSEYQAIMPIRGKILNCLKADYARIFKSDVIVDLIKVMGCGVELGGKHKDVYKRQVLLRATFWFSSTKLLVCFSLAGMVKAGADEMSTKASKLILSLIHI